MDVFTSKRGPLKRARKRIFTLVELLAVMAILAILMGIGVGVFRMANVKMAESRTEALIKKIEVAFQQYYQEVGYFPQRATIGNLVIVDDNSDGSKMLIKHFPDWETMKSRDATVSGTSYTITDGFGTNLRYRSPGFRNRTTFDLGSLGADGRYGDGGELITSTNETNIYNQFGKGDDITNF